MSAKTIGGPCPKCGALLMRRERARVFRSVGGDVAYCARCNAAWDIDDGASTKGEAAPITPHPALG
jgi:hypothetical protein